jgi:thiol-disulfide isomerase/thioredoxin
MVMANRIIQSVSVILIVLVLLAIGTTGYYFLRVAPLIKRGKLEGVPASAADRPSVANFAFETAGGAHQKIADLRDKVVVVDVWATWCGTCLYSIPKIVELRNKYSDKPVEIIGLNVDDDGWAKAKPFLQKHPEINYSLAVPYPAPSFLLKSIVDLKPLGEVSAVPTFFVVDRHGRLAGKFIELGHEQEIDDLVARLLNE